MSEFEQLTEETNMYYDDWQKIRRACYMGFDQDCKYPTCAGCKFLAIMRKLAKYEDLGLSPSEVAELAKAKREGCEWTEDEDGLWRCSNCDIAWSFPNNGPKENNVNYCPQCGKKIVKVIEFSYGDEDS